jgi:hypothetical protein
MEVRDLKESDFAAFSQYLRSFVDASEETFENYVDYDPESSDIELKALYKYWSYSKELETAFIVSFLTKCVCLVSPISEYSDEDDTISEHPDDDDEYTTLHFENGVVSKCWLDTEGDYSVFDVTETVASKKVRLEVVRRLFLTPKETPEDVQRFMAVIKNPGILQKVIEDDSTPLEVLELLGMGELADPGLRGAAEAGIVQRLIAGSDWEALEMFFLKRELDDTALLLKIVQATGQLDLSILDSRGITPALVETISERSNEASQLAVAEHLYASTQVLERLAGSEFPAVVMAARTALQGQLEKLQDFVETGWQQDQVFVAEDSSATADLLLQLASSQLAAVLFAVAKNPRAPPEALRKLVTRLPLPHLLRAVAEHPHTPPDVLEQLSECPVPAVRERAKFRLSAQG